MWEVVCCMVVVGKMCCTVEEIGVLGVADSGN